MADRTSARLFGKIFHILSENPTDDNKSIAKLIWPMHKDFDFSMYQMDADQALIKLGLAKIGIDPQNPDDGEVILYADLNGIV